MILSVVYYESIDAVPHKTDPRHVYGVNTILKQVLQFPEGS